MVDHYILDENNRPVLEPDWKKAWEWKQNNPQKSIVKQEHIGDVKVSTVFLVLDHSLENSIPVLWETMIFGGDHDGYQDRYSSFSDAVVGHEAAVRMVKNEHT